MRLMLKMWKDDCGLTLTLEYVFIITILVIGLVTAWVALRQAVKSELTEIANAVAALNQSYSFTGETNCESSTAGSAAEDTCNSIFQGSVAPSCVTVVGQTLCD
jgi:Flp pilus assembly pilin Flp